MSEATDGLTTPTDNSRPVHSLISPPTDSHHGLRLRRHPCTRDELIRMRSGRQANACGLGHVHFLASVNLDRDEQLGKISDVLAGIHMALAPGALSLQLTAVCSPKGIERFRHITTMEGCESGR